jgi:DedD protein
MDKEQKKLLLVAVSVGVFLLVTITVALIVVTPKIQTYDSAFSSTNMPLGRSQSVDTSQPIINNTQETNINFDRDRAETVVSVDSNNGENVTIKIPVPSAAAVPENTDTPVAAKPAVTSTTASARQTSTAQPAAASTTARPAASAAATTSTASRATNDYWIQTGAFKALVRAEDAKEKLASKGLTSIIETRLVNGETFYRVRLGPYTSQREADYWLALVKSIDGFDESQVRQTAR